MLRVLSGRQACLAAAEHWGLHGACFTTLTSLRDFRPSHRPVESPQGLYPPKRPAVEPWPAHLACHFSTSTAQEQQLAQPAEGTVIYKGPLSSTLHRLKVLSLFSCACAVVGSPVILALDSGGMALGGKAAVAVTLGGFGVFTTGLLHWFTGPYIHRLVYQPTDDSLDITTVSMLARARHSRCRVADVLYPDTIRPQVTFKAGGRYFYLDPDHFPDLDLLARLTPPDPAEEGLSKQQ